MMRFAALLAAMAVAGCSARTAATADTLDEAVGVQAPVVDPVGIRPIPSIPAAMRGCWHTDAPKDPDEPGAAHRLIVTADTLQLEFEGSEAQVATADFVTRVGPTLIEGRFSAPGHDTVATSLELGDGSDWIPAGKLRRAEGDAGSDIYDRCGP